MLSKKKEIECGQPKCHSVMPQSIKTHWENTAFLTPLQVLTTHLLSKDVFTSSGLPVAQNLKCGSYQTHGKAKVRSGDLLGYETAADLQVQGLPKILTFLLPALTSAVPQAQKVSALSATLPLSFFCGLLPCLLHFPFGSPVDWLARKQTLGVSV